MATGGIFPTQVTNNNTNYTNNNSAYSQIPCTLVNGNIKRKLYKSCLLYVLVQLWDVESVIHFNTF